MSDAHPVLVRAQELHAGIVAALRSWRSAGWRLGVLLRELADEGLHAVLGFASIREYAVRALGLEPRQVRDLTCLGRRLADLPALTAALEDGAIGWTKAREIARVASPETESAWISWAGEVDARTLEAAVSGQLRGALPPEDAPAVRLPERRRMVFTLERATGTSSARRWR